MLAGVEEIARQEGCESISLGVWEDNVRGKRIYKKMGYTERGEPWFMVGESRRRDLVLEKAL